MYLHLYVDVQNLRVEQPPASWKFQTFITSPTHLLVLCWTQLVLMVICMIGCKQGMYSSTYY